MGSICDTLEDTNRDTNKNGVFDNGEVRLKGKRLFRMGLMKLFGHILLNTNDSLQDC